METTKRQHGGPASAPTPSRAGRSLALGGLIIALGLGASAPARATTTVINTAVTVPVTVNSGDEVDIVAGGSVTTGYAYAAVTVNTGGILRISGGSVANYYFGVDVEGGTLNISSGSVTTSITGGTGVTMNGGTAAISGGSVTGAFGVEAFNSTVNISGGTVTGRSTGGAGVDVFGGTVTISGGTVAGGFGVIAPGGTVSISGGSVTGSPYAVDAVRSGTVTISGGSVTGTLLVFNGGAVTISGCSALLSSPQPGVYDLTGTLLDGTAINTPATLIPPGQIVLDNHCSPGSLANLVAQFVTDPAVVQGLTDKLNAIAVAIAQGNAHAKAGVVGAFINQVRAQTGKSITAQQAAILIQLVSAL